MIVRELITLLGFKTDQQSLTSAENAFTGLKSMAGKAAAGIAGYFSYRFLKGTVEEIVSAGMQIRSFSRRTGIAIKDAEELASAAAATGGDIWDFGMAVRYLSSAQVDAANGGKKQIKMFKDLGINIKDSNGKFKSSMDLFYEIADAFPKLGSDAERTSYAIDLFGRSGMSMIPMLKDGSKALKEKMQLDDQYGAKMGGDLIEQTYAYTMAMREMGMVGEGLKITVVKDLIPALARLARGFLNWYKVNKDWIRLAVGKPFKMLSLMVAGLGYIIGLTVESAQELWEMFSPKGRFIIAAAAGIRLIQMALMRGPIAVLFILGALLALAIDDWKTYKEGGISQIGQLAQAFDLYFGTGTKFQDTLKYWKEFWNPKEGELGGWGYIFKFWNDQAAELLATITKIAKFLGYMTPEEKAAAAERGQTRGAFQEYRAGGGTKSFGKFRKEFGAEKTPYWENLFKTFNTKTVQELLNERTLEEYGRGPLLPATAPAGYSYGLPGAPDFSTQINITASGISPDAVKSVVVPAVAAEMNKRNQDAMAALKDKK